MKLDIMSVSIERRDDEHVPGRYKVVILHENNLVGTPLRNVSHEEVVRFIDSIKFAFEYGFGFCLQNISSAIFKSVLTTKISNIEDPE